MEAFKDIVSIIDCTFIENDLKNTLKFEIGNHWGYLSSSQVQHDIFQNLNGVDRNLITGRRKETENIFMIIS